MLDRLDAYERLVRAHRTLTGALAAEKRAKSEAELLREVCRVAVEDAGYRLAWIGYVDAAPGRVRPVAHFGCEDGYLQAIEVTWDEGPCGRGPTGTALRTRKTSVARDLTTAPNYEPWRQEATRRGYASSCALVLRLGDELFGALSLYAPEPNAFDAAEIELLEHVADVCARGIGVSRGSARLGQMERELQRLDRIDGASGLAATIAHDVNNCLAVLLPSIEALGADPLAAEARTAVARAISLNRELMRLGHPLASPAQAVSIDDTIRSLGRALEHAAAPAALCVELGSDPWQAGMAPVHVERVLTNLLLNARDATPPGGRVSLTTRRLTLSAPMSAPYVGVAAGDYVSMRVTDTGHGIAPDARERLFEPFFTTKGERGTGLGLASVFGLVRQHGGRVFVESEPGHGATFEVLLARAS